MLKLVFDHKVRHPYEWRADTRILFDQRQNLIGDMLVSTIAFRAIKDRWPDWRVHVLAGRDNREVLHENTCVDEVHLMSGLLPTAARLQAERFDVFYCHLNRLRLEDFVLLRRTGARTNIGRTRDEFALFDHCIDDPRGTERDRYLALLDFLAIDGRDYGYEFPLNSDESDRARSFLSGCPGTPTIVFNAFGNPRGKRFSRTTSCSLITEIAKACPDAGIVLISSPACRAAAAEIRQELGLRNVYHADHIRTIRDSAALIQQSDAVVTPDTSIVHIACAYDRPQLCVYRDATELALWQPFSDRAVVLLPPAPSRDVDDVGMSAFREGVDTMLGYVRTERGSA